LRNLVNTVVVVCSILEDTVGVKGDVLAVIQVVGDTNNNLIPLTDSNRGRRKCAVDTNDRTFDSIGCGSYIGHFPFEDLDPGIDQRI